VNYSAVAIYRNGVIAREGASTVVRITTARNCCCIKDCEKDFSDDIPILLISHWHKVFCSIFLSYGERNKYNKERYAGNAHHNLPLGAAKELFNLC
jgi:hypothetical protein